MDDTRIALRRQIAAALGYTLREDVCALAAIKPATEEAWRKRGKAPAAYVRLGNEILYETAGLATSLKAGLRDPSDRGDPGVL